MEKMTPLEISEYGHLDHATLEAMLVGHLVGDPDLDEDKPPGQSPADLLLDSGIRQDWFENKSLGGMFAEFLAHYREKRTLMSLDEFRVRCGISGLTPDQSLWWEAAAASCHGAAITRSIGADALIKRMTNRTRCIRADLLHKKFVKEREDANVGPEKALENFRKACVIDLVDPGGGPIRSFNLLKDFQSTRGWMIDMKRNPDKYQGCRCGIDIIDDKTNGFSNGQLTVFVAKHGGFKSTMMLNVAFGLWLRGYNVLYASLEMEARMLMAKLWCRATQKVFFGRIVSGRLTEESDWGEVERLEGQIAGEGDHAARATMEKKRSILKGSLEGIQRGMKQEDLEQIDTFHKSLSAGRNNHFEIINTGQSGKLKCSQLESWLRERQTVFRPHVVFVDYLSLMAPEIPHPDRKDIEFGDICKYLRKMGDMLGFGIVTAAQLKKAAYDRMRRNTGGASKLAFSTDDIAESMQIGADADNVFTMMAEDGGNRLRIFTTKARYGAIDDDGKTLQVVPFTCTIGNDIEDTSVIAGSKSMSDAAAALKSGDQDALRSPDQEDWMAGLVGGSPDSGDDIADPLDDLPAPSGGSGEF
jgi:replicative DNA helicase